jgi:hypothetical protein
VELEAYGRIAPTVGKNEGKTLKKAGKSANPASALAIVQFFSFWEAKPNRLLAIMSSSASMPGLVKMLEITEN